jgi:uncharacterized membrane protein YhaH (DUF805 family)
MVTANPFAPPGAMVGDIDAETAFQPVRFWPPGGRIGRVRLIGYSVGLYFLLVVSAFVLGIIAGFVHAGSTLVAVITSLAYVFLSALLFIQRSHDMNWSGWMSLLAIIPFVGLIWVIKAGSPGSNGYGAPPPPNTTGVKVLAWFFPAIMIIGIVAAIALPAYQDYTVRAKAAKVGNVSR